MQETKTRSESKPIHKNERDTKLKCDTKVNDEAKVCLSVAELKEVAIRIDASGGIGRKEVKITEQKDDFIDRTIKKSRQLVQKLCSNIS